MRGEGPLDSRVESMAERVLLRTCGEPVTHSHFPLGCYFLQVIQNIIYIQPAEMMIVCINSCAMII